MRGMYVPLGDELLDRLRESARVNRRRPQDQATVLLERALEQKTCESPLPASPTPRPPEAPR